LRALRAAVDLGVVGSQAFVEATALSVDLSTWNTASVTAMHGAFQGGDSATLAGIGEWNTAAVTSLSYVCAAFGPAARHRGGRARSMYSYT
jgi:surface protein